REPRGGRRRRRVPPREGRPRGRPSRTRRDGRRRRAVPRASQGARGTGERGRARGGVNVAQTVDRPAQQHQSLPANWRYVMQTCNPPKGRVDTVSRWLVLTRACVQPMTITAAAIAGLLAVDTPGADWFLFALAAVGSVLAHASNNLMNDLFD